MAQTMDRLLGLPKVNHLVKYLLLIWLIASLVLSSLLTIRSVNQLKRDNHVNVPFELPFSYNFNYEQLIPENYVIGVIVMDAFNYLFTLLLIVGVIELHPKILSAGSVGAGTVSTVATIGLLLISFVYKQEFNQITIDYLNYNLVLHIIRSLVGTLLAAPVQRQVVKRSHILKQIVWPGSVDTVHAQVQMQPTAPSDGYYR